jgi:2-phospho-L-lactate guanylyltransferase
MDWTIAVPLKQAGTRKSRLAPKLDAATRDALADSMARHVLSVIAATPSATPLLLCRHRPEWWDGDWRDDDAQALNPAIGEARNAVFPAPFAIVHADLPLLTIADVTALLAAAERTGLSIAPDRHGTGTNAVAIADDRPFRFAFGAASFARHRAQGGAVVEQEGLALDIDTLDDFERATAAGSLPLI